MSSKYSLETAEWCKKCLLDHIDYYHIRGIAGQLVNSEKFLVWSGSSLPNQHHYGKHGLIVHTMEVVDLCRHNASYAKMTNWHDTQLILLAAIFHDSGKLFDYEPVDESYEEWRSTDHKRKIHHISRSALEFQSAVSMHNLDNSSLPLSQSKVDEVLHAILAHHGQRAWGSPVAPKTKLAWLLHLCDGLSARLNDADTWDPYSSTKG